MTESMATILTVLTPILSGVAAWLVVRIGLSGVQHDLENLNKRLNDINDDLETEDNWRTRAPIK